MYYINAQPNESGNYGNPVSNKQEGMVALPDGLLDAYIEAKGFVTLDEVVDGGVVAFTLNQEALDAYLADHPDQPEPTPEKAVTWASMATSIKEGVDEV